MRSASRRHPCHPFHPCCRRFSLCRQRSVSRHPFRHSRLIRLIRRPRRTHPDHRRVNGNAGGGRVTEGTAGRATVGHPLRRVTHYMHYRGSQQPSHPSRHPARPTSPTTSRALVRMTSGWRVGAEAAAALHPTALGGHPEGNRPTGCPRSPDHSRHTNRFHPPRSSRFCLSRMTVAVTPTTTVMMRRMTGCPGGVSTPRQTLQGHPHHVYHKRMTPPTPQVSRADDRGG